MRFDRLYQFTSSGIQKFEAFFRGEVSSEHLDPTGSAFATTVGGSKEFETKDFQTTKEMASAILASLGSNTVEDVLHNKEFWAWLTFVQHNNLFK